MIWNVLAQLLLALGECHSSTGKGVILHRDIKPENVFLDGDHMVKLGDFGLSRTLERPDIDLARTFVGTPYYMSPEIVNETKYDAKSDIWALGCLIYEMCTLKPPFQAESQAALYAKISQAVVERIPSRYSEELDKMVKSMLHYNRAGRPDAAELLRVDKVKLNIGLLDLKRRETVLREQELQFERNKEAFQRAQYEFSAQVDELNRNKLELAHRESALICRENELQQNAKENMSSDSSLMPPPRTVHNFANKRQPVTPVQSKARKADLLTPLGDCNYDASMMMISPGINNENSRHSLPDPSFMRRMSTGASATSSPLR
eukprot:Partr_v1_DN26478_c0_g1_i1_m23795 putative S_TKc